MPTHPNPDPESHAPQTPSKPEFQFAARGTTVYYGRDLYAQARTANSAQRIAKALNWYKPGRRGY